METLTTRPGLATWWEASRPRTLPASVAPVLVGTAAAALVAPEDGGAQVLWGRLGLALAVALALQIAVNFANDYFDGVRGVDTEDRVGPRRLVASGIVTPSQMKRGMAAALGVAAVAGLGLAAMAGWELLLVGAAALLAAVGYSGGPKPYASAGLGEVFVFVFFGVVATAGSAYVQDEHLTTLALVASLPMGLLATALLVVNNLRDIGTDTAVGKVTLAVRLGEVGTRRLYGLMLGGAMASVPVLAVVAGSPWPLVGLLAAPLALPALRVVRTAQGPALIAALGLTARLQLVLALLLVVGLGLRGVGA